MAKQLKTCRYCGVGNLVWPYPYIKGVSRLIDRNTGQVHVCNITRQQLLQKALQAGLNPDVAANMRLRDLKEWLDAKDGIVTDTPDTPEVTEDSNIVPKEEVVKENEDILVDPNGEHHHPNFSVSLALYKAALHVSQWWKGPAGGGKTSLAKQVATALGKELVVIAISKNLQEFDLLGYNDGHGNYVRGQLYDAVHGKDKFILLDECDRGNDGVLVRLNSVLEQRSITFPNNETVEIDPSIVFAASGNTWGRGADAVYTAAGALDAAFLDRFPVKLDHDYDEAFERKLALARCAKAGAWVTRVQAVRKAVFDLRLTGIVVSPRLSLAGADLLNNGIATDWLEKFVLWPNIPTELQASVKEKLRYAA